MRLMKEFENEIANESIELEALIYITGYVAHRYRHKYPMLGVRTKTLPPTDDWLFCISRGNCMYPSTEFQMAAKIMNDEFVKFHGNRFSKESQIFDKLSNIICKQVSFPPDVIACLVRTRTYIRLRHINMLIKQENYARKEKKKLKRMCNKI